MGSVIRSKEKLIVNKEIPNKMLYQTEKINQTKKQIITLQNEQNKTLTNNHEILKECHNYYQQLYKKQNNCKLTQQQLLTNIPKLVATNQNKQLTKPIQKSELKQAIEQTENEKLPGIDGIPIEFYKTFYDLLETELLKLHNNILFREKEITNTMHQAIITLIPKKGDINKLKYWRPISLLCNDYKILTKILANRIKTILPEIISEEQICSIPTRTIFNNIFLIRDAIKINKEKNATFCILQIDQEKAFDKIYHNLLKETLQQLGFSELFLQFIKILYKNNTSYIINNGFLSSTINLERGLRQGCPLSLPLYVI